MILAADFGGTTIKLGIVDDFCFCRAFCARDKGADPRGDRRIVDPSQWCPEFT